MTDILSQEEIDALLDVVEDSGYDYPEELRELARLIEMLNDNSLYWNDDLKVVSGRIFEAKQKFASNLRLTLAIQKEMEMIREKYPERFI